MILLLDQNLSYRISTKVRDVFPDINNVESGFLEIK